MNANELALRDLVAPRHRATAPGDVDTVLGLMADDVVFLVAGHPPLHGRGAFESGVRHLLTRCRIESAGEIRGLRDEPVEIVAVYEVGPRFIERVWFFSST